jgi:acetyl-CoA C-acetyltransferase
MKGFHNKEKGIGIVYDDMYLINGARTPFGKLSGSLSQVSPTDLGIIASRAAIKRADVSPVDIDQVIVANIGQSSYDSYFLPRHIGLYSGVPQSVPAVMLQRICGSGFETITAAADQVTLGKAGVVLCTGTENMSLAPTVCYGNRNGYALGKVEFKDFLWEALNDTAAVPMGNTAENVARHYKITRQEADDFAMRSVERALAATSRGYFKDEITPVNTTTIETDGLNPRKVKLPKKLVDFISDENIRASTIEEMGRLPSAFEKEGVQTAANSSGIVDGAASVVVAGKKSLSLSMHPLARILASATSAVDPALMGLAPVPAIRLLLELTGLKLSDIGLFEINEAFAAQFIGVERELGIDRNICNVNGGAISIGHPLAASGLRLSLTLCREMKARGVRYGIASACIGGGQGNAILFENLNI